MGKSLVVLAIRRNDDAVERSPGFAAFPVISNASCPVLSVPGFLSDLAVSNEVGGNPESSQLAAD